MKRLIALAFLLLSSGAFADFVTRSGQNELRLMASPCVHAGILGHLKEEWRAKFNKAQASISGKTHYACWIDTGDGSYFVIWEDGTGVAYAITSFLHEPGI